MRKSPAVHSVYVDKENLNATRNKSVTNNPSKGQVKSQTHGRKALGNVGNTIQCRRPSTDTPKLKKDKIKQETETLPSDGNDTELPQTENGAPINDEWPEIEYMPTIYEPEDTYEDIWPKEERLTADDFMALKFFPQDVCREPSPLSPLKSFPEDFFLPLENETFECDYLAPREIDELLLPVPLF